ncbi:MAG: VOC family protein [Candidatus Omnitrophica bacterium]|nr:VOC family protein [Candidatus Omnitrophota bacterium]
MIENLRHACVVVKNLERSLKFYRDIMGLKMSKILTVEGRDLETIFNIKGIKLTYVKMRFPKQPKNSLPAFELHYWHKPRISPEGGYNHISFTVKDMDREYGRLKKSGVKFLSKPVKVCYSDAKICFCLDPDGHLIELIEDLAN